MRKLDIGTSMLFDQKHSLYHSIFKFRSPYQGGFTSRKSQNFGRLLGCHKYFGMRAVHNQLPQRFKVCSSFLQFVSRSTAWTLSTINHSRSTLRFALGSTSLVEENRQEQRHICAEASKGEDGWAGSFQRSPTSTMHAQRAVLPVVHFLSASSQLSSQFVHQPREKMIVPGRQRIIGKLLDVIRLIPLDDHHLWFQDSSAAVFFFFERQEAVQDHATESSRSSSFNTHRNYF